jgi:predicted nucleic acid-binding protein
VKKYVLDSYAIIAFFEDEAGADLVADVLQELIRKKSQGFMSIINWGEIYYSTMKEQGVEKAEQAIWQLQKYPIQLVEADRSLTYEAAKLKGIYKIAYADCFATALAMKLKARLITGDPEFKKIDHRLDVLWI